MGEAKRIYTTLEHFASLNRLTLFGDFGQASVAAAADACWAEICELLERAERCASPVRDDSDLARFNAAPAGTCVQTDELTAAMVAAAERAEALSGGTYNPLAGPLVDAWGFAARVPRGTGGAVPAARAPQHMPAPEAIAAAQELCRHDKPLVRRGCDAAGNDAWFLDKPAACVEIAGAPATCRLDLGGVAKGVVVDRIRRMLGEYGFAYGTYSCASSIAVLRSAGEVARKRGTFDFTVNLTDPTSRPEDGRSFFMVYAHDRCISTSGGYGDRYEAGGLVFSHIIDPRTGCPCGLERANGELRERASVVDAVTLIGAEAGLGDALTTALCAMRPQEAAAFYERALRPAGWDIVLAWHEAGGDRLAATSLPEGSYHLRGGVYRLVGLPLKGIQSSTT